MPSNLLGWTANTDSNTTGYHIEAGADPGTGSPPADVAFSSVADVVGINTVTYEHTTSATDLWYRVASDSAAGVGAYSSKSRAWAVDNSDLCNITGNVSDVTGVMYSSVAIEIRLSTESGAVDNFLIAGQSYVNDLVTDGNGAFAFNLIRNAKIGAGSFYTFTFKKTSIDDMDLIVPDSSAAQFSALVAP